MLAVTDRTLYLLTGPTAVGKTDLAVQWALEHDAEIVSCDALLFYHGMEIGTAKPDCSLLEQVTHHCMDLVPVHEPYNIAEYLKVAREAVDSIHERGKRVLVTGGSGFYLKGFVAPVVDAVEVPPAVDAEVEQLYQTGGLEAVVKRLQDSSPEDAHLIDLQNPRRVIPALKRCLATGLSVGALLERMRSQSGPFSEFSTVKVLLQRNMEDLVDRIQERTALMLQLGLLDEVQRLVKLGIERNPTASRAIGYREVIAYLQGEVSLEELPLLIERNTLQLVKKQNKWFRSQMQFDRVINLSGEDVTPANLFTIAQGGSSSIGSVRVSDK